MQNRLFDKLYEEIQSTKSNIAQMTVLQHGKEVYSAQWDGYKPEDCVHVMSVTKSVVALLVGIAMQKGLIKDLDTPVLDYFPSYKVKRGEKTIYSVTLRHLLTMKAPYKYKSEPWTKVCTSEDWTVAALDLLGGKQGLTDKFNYSTLGIQILCGILEKTCLMSPLDFANTYLFMPLGIEKRTSFFAETAEDHKEFTISKKPKGKVWFVDPRHIPTAGYGLCLSSNEMAKIGLLCLNKGVYDGNRLLSEEWIELMTRPSTPKMEAFGNMNYGMLWWIVDPAKRIYAACGTGGNVIYIQPDMDVVVAVGATFKPAVYDRVPFIQNKVVPLL